MVSWWPLDEGVGVTTADLVGQNDGRLGREPTDPVWSAGFVGNALRFDGVDDVVRHTGDPSLDIAEAITLDAWIFPTATKSQTIVRRSASPFSSYSLALSRGRHVVFSLPISGSPPVDVRITGYAINTWTHVAGTYDGTSMKLYVNGELVNSAPRSGPLLTTPTGGNLLIGTRLSLPSGTFQGLIDEVESFDRALSETEIRSIFNAGPHGKCKARLLVQIDVKPDSDENPINSLSHGVIAVAILASESFDTADIDVTTLAFGPDGATPAHQSGHFEDVNGDGLVDLVSHYATGETGIAFGDTQACATGMLLDGTRFQGCTPVHAF
jgi:hypothetical protein